MTKILWIPQLSFIDKQSGQFLLDSDSNIAFLRRMLPVLHNTLPDWDIDLMLPEHLDSADLIFPKVLHKIKNEKLFINDAFLGRVHCPIVEWKRVLTLTEPDVLFLNTPELVQTFTTLREKLNLDFKIITYNHWVDLIDVQRVPSSMSYIWRQTEGAYKSDIALFNSNFIIEKFLNSTRSFFGNGIADSLEQKCLPLYIPWKSKNITKNKKISSKVSIMWSQRLSQNSFYLEDREKWFNIFDKYSDKIDLFVSNPAGFSTSESKTYTKETGPWDYAEFLQKLANVDLSFGPTASPIQWSLNFCDALEVGTPSFVQYKDAFTEIIRPEYPFASLSKEGLVAQFEELFMKAKIWELREKSKNLTKYFAFDNKTVKQQLLQMNEFL